MSEILKIELLKNFKKDKIFFLLMLINFTSLILVFVTAMNYSIDSSIGLKQYEESYINRRYFNLYPDARETTEINKEDRLKNMIDCYNELSEKFMYDASYNHPLFIEKNIFKGNETFLDGYEDGYADKDSEYLGVKGYLIGKYFKDVENVEMESGRYFLDDEFKYSESRGLPVILGADYKEFYNIGDYFELDYCGKINVYVIGFLKDDAFILDNNNKVYLNRYMLIPSFDIEYNELSNDEEKKMMDFHYDVKLMGRLVLNRDELDKKNEFQDILNKYKLYSYYLYNKTESAEKVYYEQQENAMVMKGLALIIFIFTLISLMISMISKVYKNIKKYSIHILIGARPSRVMKFVLIESIVIYFLSSIISIIILFIMYRLGLNPYVFDIRIWTSIIVGIFILIIVSYYAILKKIKTMGISQLLRRND